jgi:hypothetical protein
MHLLYMYVYVLCYYDRKLNSIGLPSYPLPHHSGDDVDAYIKVVLLPMKSVIQQGSRLNQVHHQALLHEFEKISVFNIYVLYFFQHI